MVTYLCGGCGKIHNDEDFDKKVDLRIEDIKTAEKICEKLMENIIDNLDCGQIQRLDGKIYMHKVDFEAMFKREIREIFQEVKI